MIKHCSVTLTAEDLHFIDALVHVQRQLNVGKPSRAKAVATVVRAMGLEFEPETVLSHILPNGQRKESGSQISISLQREDYALVTKQLRRLEKTNTTKYSLKHPKAIVGAIRIAKATWSPKEYEQRTLVACEDSIIQE